MSEHTHITGAAYYKPTDVALGQEAADTQYPESLPESTEASATDIRVQSIATTAIQGHLELPNSDVSAATSTEVKLDSVLAIRRARKNVALIGKSTPASNEEEDSFLREVISHFQASDAEDNQADHKITQSLHALRETCFEALEHLMERRITYWVQKYGNWNPDRRQEIESIVRISLFQAAQRFDPTKLNTFVTFAARTVPGSVQQYLRDSLKQQSGLRRGDLELAAAIKRELKLGKDLSTVAQDLDVNEDDAREVTSLVEAARSTTSIDLPKNARQLHASQNTKHTPEDIVTKHYLDEELQIILSRASLSLRDRHILKYRFSIDETAHGHFYGDPLQESKTHKEIAAMVGCSESSIHKTEKKLVSRLGRGLGILDS